MGVLSTQILRLPFFSGRRSAVSAKSLNHSFGGDFRVVRPVEQVEEDGNNTFEIAFRRGELKAALELVYREYVRSGLTHLSRHGIRVTAYHTLPTTEVFVVKDRGQVVCTMSLVRDAMLGVPMESIYTNEINQRRRMGIRLAEVSCLAFDRKEEYSSFAGLSRLMAFTAQCAVRRGVHQLVIAVHPRHASFYRRFLAFEYIGEEKIYAAVRGNPAVAMVLDLRYLSVSNSRAYRRLFGKPFSEETLRYKPVSPKLWYELRCLAEDICAVESSGVSPLIPACA